MAKKKSRYAIILDVLYDAPALQSYLPLSFVGSLKQARACTIVDGGPVEMPLRENCDATIVESKVVWHMGSMQDLKGAIYFIEEKTT